MKTRVFMSGNSKAVRIPASVHLAGPVVELVDLGKKGILLRPTPQAEDPWKLFREGLDDLGGEWPEREQETDQTRADW
jgi:virulence-associated protein VagC